LLRKLAIAVLVLAILAGAVFWLLTMPRTIAESDLPPYQPDATRGEYMFAAGGCTSCHAAPDATGEDRLKLAGGLALKTPFGTFHAPVTSMKFGVGRGGTHLYPAFPYTSYQRMRVEDVMDLKAYLDTLPPVATDAPGHELPFPFSIRRGLGLWQLLYVDGTSFMPDPAKIDDAISRGAYLVRGPGHCGECHSPRNVIGGIDSSRAYAGGPAPEGDGTIPNITPDEETGIGSWSEDEIVEAFQTGTKPNFDDFSGAMKHVQENLAKLAPEDLAAIAAYLKSLPPIKSERPAPAG
jgi:mono/diheme cytochrome c family protein